VYHKNLELTSPKEGGRSGGIVRPRTEDMGFDCFLCLAIDSTPKTSHSKGRNRMQPPKMKRNKSERKVVTRNILVVLRQNFMSYVDNYV
jgi:hypothetical protein